MTARRAVAALVLLWIALAGCSVVATVLSGWPGFVHSYSLTNLVIGLGFLGSGAVIAWFRVDNRLGWLLLACGLGHLVSAAAAPLAAAGAEAAWPEAVVRGLSTLFLAGWLFGLVGLFPLVLLLFPDGHLPSRRWRPVGWLIVGQLLVQVAVEVASGLPALDDHPATVSLLSTGLELPDAAWAVVNLANVVTVVLVLVSLVLRYRRGPEQPRRQVQWLILAVLALAAINSQRWLTGDGPILLLLTFVLVPVAIAVAVVRHQLLDIRLVVSRAVLYLMVSLALVAGYAGLVATLSLLVPDDADRAVAALSALAVAFAFAPVRALVQGAVDRLFYGDRGDALTAAEDVARQVVPGADLDEVLDQARRSLRLPALALVRDGVVVAGCRPGGRPPAVVDLAAGTPSAAVLEVGLRRGEETLHPDDRRVLALIATPLALALHSADLAQEVRASRTALVGAHAEERLRLHRELHDGLGPVLTGAAFRADAASNVLRRDAEAAERLLEEVRAGIRLSIDGVRRVVYGLRPVELEEQGLVEALRARLAGQDGAVAVRLEAPEELPELPPAVEIAAFRIVSEAVANVLRHARASRCEVRLTTSPSALCVEVSDDGPGGGPWTAGVGLRSLLLRAEEVGGHAVAGPTASGGRVMAELPFTGGNATRLTAPDLSGGPLGGAARR